MCKVLQVSRSGFYAWCRRGPSEREQANAKLAEEIREIHRANRRAYGSPRIYRELRSRGHHCGRHRVAQIMRLEGIRGCSKQRFYRTATVRAERKAAPDLLAREFAVEAANRVWVGDITQIRTREGWLFLAVILDLFSRKVVGNLEPASHRAGLGCSSHGSLSKKAQARIDPSLRSRSPVPER